MAMRHFLRKYSRPVRIYEVGPRDGLQNEPAIVDCDKKLRLIELLSKAGLANIEVTSFVSPKWVPQLADSAELCSRLSKSNTKSMVPWALVPNRKGLDLAMNSAISHIAVFTTASEEFSKKNVNMSVERSLAEIRQICATAKANGLKIRGYVSCVFACPYEGWMAPVKTVKVVEELLSAGCDEISLGDTIGAGTAGHVRKLLREIKAVAPVDRFAAHYHNTYGQALANILASLDDGIRTFDSSIAGLGGCPFAKGATGNIATEELVYLLDGLGMPAGVSLEKLLLATRFVRDECKIDIKSSAAATLLAKSTQ